MTPFSETPIALNKLSDQLRDTTQAKHPPVDQWQPKHTGVIDIVIRTDGTWLHEGSPIERDHHAERGDQ